MKRQFDKFAFDVASLPAWVDQNIDQILPALFKATRFLDNVTIVEGVKGSIDWNGLSITGTLRDKSGCGFTDDATVSFPKVTLTTKPVGIDVELCRRDLNGKWTQVFNPRGAQAELESLSFTEVLTLGMIQLAAEKWQRLLLLGDTSAVDVNIVHHDGLLKKLVTTSAVSTYNISGFTLTNPADVYEMLESLALAIDEKVRDNATLRPAIYVGSTLYERARKHLFDANLYHVAPTSENVGSSRAQMILPRSEVVVRKFSEIDAQPASYGATPTSAAYAVVENYIGVGTDDPQDYQDFNLWYNQDNRTIRGAIEWYSGIAIWRPELFIRTVTS